MWKTDARIHLLCISVQFKRNVKMISYVIILPNGDLLCSKMNIYVLEKVNEHEVKSIKSTHQWHSSY